MIIDLNEKRDAKNAPDSNCKTFDFDGNPIFLYSASYRHSDRTFSLDFWAKDLEDAKECYQNIMDTLRFDGQVVSRGNF